MANPTTNFGWQMPTNSDLVTDLPADFEVFGQGVDTSLADLKGGTTGQVLSKASNTDMDFTWTTAAPGDITGVSVTSPITGGGTSGDVTIGISSSAVVPSQTGNSGKYLTTDGTTSSWATIAAGGLTLLSTTTLANTTTTISGISADYVGLLINVISPTVSAATRIDVQTNSSNLFTGSTLASKTTWDQMSGDPLKITANANLSTTSPNMSTTIWIPNYVETSTYKTVMFFGGYNKSASGQEATFGIGQLTTNSAISSLTFLTANGTSTMSGTVKIYGVK